MKKPNAIEHEVKWIGRYIFNFLLMKKFRRDKHFYDFKFYQDGKIKNLPTFSVFERLLNVGHRSGEISREILDWKKNLK